MELLLSFAPFLAFLVAGHLAGIVFALCAGAGVAGALVVRDQLRGAREIRVLEAGTAVLFTALAACAMSMDGIAWSVGLVRLVVDCGLMLLVVAGVAAGRPFTLGFIRAQVSPARASTPAFLGLNRRIASAWAAAFGVLAISDLVLMLAPACPVAVPVSISVAGVLAAMKFTQRMIRRSPSSGDAAGQSHVPVALTKSTNARSGAGR